MAYLTILHFLCVLGVFHKGLTALIQTQQTVMAALGEEAHFSCRLMQTRDVLQVTWQKCSSDGEKTVATDNKYFGQRVDPYFKGRVEFKDGGLQNTSIVIREVTEYDEGCYHCLFNTYPDGALTGTTCLQMYELYGPVLRVRDSDSSEEAVVSCSATGRPAPTVTFMVTQQDFYVLHNSSVIVNNTNGTDTVTRTAVLSRLHDNSAQVECAVQVLSVPPKKVFVTIPEVEQTSSSDDFDVESGSANRGRSQTWIILFSVFGIVFCVAAVTFLLFKYKKLISLSHSFLEMIEVPTATVSDPHVAEASLQEGQIRLRTSPVKSQASSNTNPSPVTSRPLMFD
uniref:OX-2 membrane glycoprotein-like n=1 Tax=Semicossyphus pulcher TaxID=241346 RepID=UPI0037E748C1